MYRLIQSDSIEAIDTVEKAMESKNIVMNWAENQLTANIVKLKDNTKYFFAVLVRDIGGNISLYTPKEVTTTPIPVYGVKLDNKSVIIYIGETKKLTETIIPDNAADKTVKWSSSKSNKVSVDSTGVVTAIAPGIITVTVTTNHGGFTESCEVIVPPVEGVIITKETIYLAINETHQLEAIVTPSTAADKSVTWSSSDETKIAVNSSGVITGKTSGSATITVTTNDGGFTDTCQAVVPNLPTLTTTAISGIYKDRAAGGGEITSDGGGPVTSRGICWSTSANPTTNDAKTVNGIGTGIFTGSMANLNGVTTYYVRAYAANGGGTAYGNEVTFVTQQYTLRDIGPAGGYVFYDKGYYSDGWRYMEAAPFATQWSSKRPGAYNILIGGTGTVVGTGKANTGIIVAWLDANTVEGDYGDVTYKAERAAYLCDNLVVVNGGVTYDDWFLPSKDELWQICWNLQGKKYELGETVLNPEVSTPVGSFAEYYYWSSSEGNASLAWTQYFGNGSQTNFGKGSAFYVRAVRAF